LQNTTLFISTNEGSSFPIWAKVVRIVVEQLRLSSEILPVVCIVTLGFVVFLVEWTPLSLEIELIEV